jgi:NAD(P)H-hydrate epimerase
MKIFSASQIRNWDSYTIEHEPVKSIDLMERAATACFNWIIQNFKKNSCFRIFCGMGNNGGDGLAIARLLTQKKYAVTVFILKGKSAGSADFLLNLKKLQKTSTEIIFIEDKESFPRLSKDDVIIDTLFGTGLNKKPSGLIADLIKHINKNSAKIISVDIPSGMYVDKSSKNNPVINAAFTLTFQNIKLAFLMPENASCFGKIVLLDIGLSKNFEEDESASFELIDQKIIDGIYRPRDEFSNKGNLGYACLLAGSYGMMGAAVLASRACLRSGVGKLTCIICKEGYTILQTAVPEAMSKVSGDQFIKDVKDVTGFDVIGIGPGIGKYPSHKNLLQQLFTQFNKPIVIDADALNILSENQDLYQSIPKESMITPHPKEFERLFGKVDSDFDRINLALAKAKEFEIFIVLKGHYTFIATPQGKGYFNSTGNGGMATAGAGDVLTGIITGLCAQKYSSLNACILGVYLHGLSGDIAAKNISKEALIAGDIIENIGNGFKEISP